MKDINLVMIDPGHGGDDNGAAYGFAEEDDTNLSIAYLLRWQLEKRFFSVAMTREKDELVTLAQRCLMANALPADLFISIHCDAYHKETSRGMSVHIHPQASARSLAVAVGIHAALIAAFPAHRDRGIRRSDFHVLRNTAMPAVLIECEFLSNPETRRFLREPENQLALAQAIANGKG